MRHVSLLSGLALLLILTAGVRAQPSVQEVAGACFDQRESLLPFPQETTPTQLARRRGPLPSALAIRKRWRGRRGRCARAKCWRRALPV